MIPLLILLLCCILAAWILYPCLDKIADWSYPWFNRNRERMPRILIVIAVLILLLKLAF